MPGVKARDGEPVERLLKHFKKQVEKAGIMSEIKKRQHYEKPCVQRKKKRLAARKRMLKTQRKLAEMGY